MSVQEKRHHRLAQVSAGHFALQERLKSRAQDHQLINQMADLQALIIILRRPPADSRILVLQGITVMLLGIEAFIFDLPAQPAGAAKQGHRRGRDRQVGHMDKTAANKPAAVLSI